MTELLTPETRAHELPYLGQTGWEPVPDRDAIRKVLRLRNFSEAWALMSRIALLAEKLNHHPEWSNTFNLLDITLTTHDCGGLSDLDIRMARAIDRIAVGEVVAQNGPPILSLCQERAARRQD